MKRIIKLEDLIFNENFKKNFFSNNFGKKYIYNQGLVKNSQSIMSLDILNEELSNKSYWNNKNFIMMLDKKHINYSEYSSSSHETSGYFFRPDIDKVQDWVSRGASIILNEIERLNSRLINISSQLQNLTKGRCQGNLYFSMESHQAFGPHCDEHDVFAIHFEGEKIWNIYENIEKNPINHPIFKWDSEERTRRAGKLIDQVTLKPGDLLYLPRGQYHDALASKNGAVHIAFGLTYFKPIDLISNIWDKFILNDFMRKDINQNANVEDLKLTLIELSKEIENILISEETNKIAHESLKNWSYKINNYSLQNIITEGRKYKVSKSVRFERNPLGAFLISGKDKVEIPLLYSDITEFILKQELVTSNLVSSHFKKINIKIISDCIKKLNDMKVIT